MKQNENSKSTGNSAASEKNINTVGVYSPRNTNRVNKQSKNDTEAKKAHSKTVRSEVPRTIGSRRPFAMAEAYKRLRTNIMFSFADDSQCHIIGVTSAMAHEGKSTTSINLAYDLMKAGKKTVLVDADMRLSNFPKALAVKRAPGLSNVLVGNNKVLDTVQYSDVHDGMEVITCGDFPPNPTELLSSNRFAAVLEALKEEYEYIILDLPPVAEVSDALIASKLVDGMLLVIRQEYADKRALDDTIHQLKFGGARIIGIVLTCVLYETKYSKYKYKYFKGKKYGTGNKYGYGRKFVGYYAMGGEYERSYYSSADDKHPATSGSKLFEKIKYKDE